MNFVNNSMLYNYVLDGQCLLDDVYKAVNAVDMAGAVMSALRILRDTRTLPEIVVHEKSSEQSSIYRNKGNAVYAKQQYFRALAYYNMALLYAPKDSIELVQAYSNRSALLLKVTAYSACLNDIETCFKLVCRQDLLVKLHKRKEECENLIWRENIKNGILKSSFTQEFFKFNVKKHPEISCVSADVDIVSESGQMKAVAAKNIAIGTVVAIETAFTTYSGKEKSCVTCYYCQKMTFNLTPCDNCCFALFCSKKCKELCINEYHFIECQIMNVLHTIDVGFKFRLAIKTVLKLKSQCKQWSTLIKESHNIGAERLKSASVNDVYDVKNYSSMLCFNDERHFIHGSMYNSCFVYATVIHHLQNICGFFPLASNDCLNAQKCLAKLLMTLELMWPSTIEVDNSAEELSANHIATDLPCHYGWFPFTSKLKHACEPNVLVLGLDNKVALVAIQPIKKMTELKMSYIGHWYERLYEDKRAMKLYQLSLGVCSCRVCKEDWTVNNLKESDLTRLQMKTFCYWLNMKENMVLPQREASFFKETCKALTILNDQVQSKEHNAVYTEFRIQMSLCQFAASNNFMISS